MNAKWVKVDSNFFSVCQFMSVKSIGTGLKAAAAYRSSGEIPDGLDEAAQVVYEMLRDGIDKSEAEYEQVCSRNRARVEKRWGRKTTDTSGIPPVYERNTDGIPPVYSTVYSTEYRIENKNKNREEEKRIEYDDARARSAKYISDVYPFLTPGNLEVAAEWCSKYPEDLIRYVVDITADKRSFRYLEKTMMRIESEGLDTLAKVKAAEAQREAQKPQGFKAPDKVRDNPALRYEQRPVDEDTMWAGFVDLSKPPEEVI